MQFNYFHTLTFGMAVQVFAEKGCRVKVHFFFSTQFDFSSFISSKHKIIEDQSKHSKVDILNLHTKGTFVDMCTIRHQFADLLNFKKTFNKMITFKRTFKMSCRLADTLTLFRPS